MQERRRESRRKTYLGGSVASPDKLSRAACVVRNLSAAGARLTFERDVLIAPEFDLEIARLRSTLRARISWHGKREMGVSFVDGAQQSNIIPLDVALRIRRLEADKRELAARIGETLGTD